MVGERRDPRQARFLTLASLRWVVAHRAWTPWHLRCCLRFAALRLRYPHIVTEGFVFLGRGARVRARRGFGRLIIGPWVHIGAGTSIRCHEGTMRIGAKAVFGADVTVNGYLDIEFGAATLIADDVYVCDFDHRTGDRTRPIKDQGIVTAPVRIGPEVWIGTKAVVLRGVRIGRGAVIAAAAVVNDDIPAYAVAAGIPAHVVRERSGRRPVIS
ncbi:MAG: acyltransferase [Mycobacteriales bacterium]